MLVPEEDVKNRYQSGEVDSGDSEHILQNTNLSLYLVYDVQCDLHPDRREVRTARAWHVMQDDSG